VKTPRQLRSTPHFEACGRSEQKKSRKSALYSTIRNREESFYTASVTSRKHPIDFRRDPLPFVMFEQGCLYRKRMIHAAEAAGRAWHMAYTSPSLVGIQAAVSVGIGVSILPEVAILPEHRALETKDGFPAITNTEIALVAAANASPATLRLAEMLCDFCSTSDPRKVA
jgi:DNA-binding transcriptional LysR family regulator